MRTDFLSLRSVITAVSEEAAGEIGVLAGTNRHEKGTGGDAGNGGRTFLKIGAKYGADISVTLWDADGKKHKFEGVKSVATVASGGQEGLSFIGGIMRAAKFFKNLGFKASRGSKRLVDFDGVTRRSLRF